MRIKLKQPTEDVRRSHKNSKKEFIDQFSEIQSDWRNRTAKRSLVLVQADLDGDFYQSNYLNFLQMAYGEHYGIVVTPDIIWHTLLSEAVLIVAENPKMYGGLFSDKPEEKQKIVIPAAGSECDLNLLIQALKHKVPSNADTFMPDFSTSNAKSRLARMAAFADLVSPYYSYGVFACGIPHVDVEGTEQDWLRVRDNWREIGKMLNGNEEYFAKTQAILDRIAAQTDSPELWQEIIVSKPCGSGSQRVLSGWFTDLYKTQPRLRTANNFSTHTAKVCYEQLQTKERFELHHGIYSSRVTRDDDFPTLTTEFGSMWFHRPETPVEEPMKY